MARDPVLNLVSATTWGALVVLGTLATWWAPADVRIEVLITSLTFAILLAIALVHSARRARRIAATQQGDVQKALAIVLELTHSQRSRWLGLLEGVATLEPEDRALFEPLLRARAEAQPVTEATTTGSSIDAIQTMILLNQSLMDDLGRILTFYESTYQKLQSMRKIHRVNHFRLHESVDFLSNIGTASNQYSESMVLGILTTFKEITQLAQNISTDVVGTMSNLMAPGNREGLDAIRHESAQISTMMDAFFSELNQAIGASQKSVTENIRQMERVKEMSDAIGEFSESIRMISLNLNIEAARGHGGNGKGFQVLAVKLSEFALRAQTLAQEQHEIIEQASAVMNASGEHEMRRLNQLVGRVPQLRSHLDPFEGIVQRTFADFEKVNAGMTGLSISIGEELRSVIGKLQYQDLVRQEHEHVLAMFAHVRDLADETTSNDGDLDQHHQDRLREGIIHHFECLATTENEWSIIRAYRLKHREISETGQCSDPDAESRPTEAGKVELF